MECSAMIASQMSAITELIKFAGDNGIMLIISGVVVYFLIKVLNSMLAQNERMVNQIVPQLQQIDNSITNIMVKINEAESRRTLVQNRQLSETRETEKTIIESLQKIDQRLDKTQDLIGTLSDEIEKLNTYLEIAKDKDDEE